MSGKYGQETVSQRLISDCMFTQTFIRKVILRATRKAKNCFLLLGLGFGVQMIILANS